MKDDDPIISVGVVSSALRYYTEKQLLSIFTHNTQTPWCGLWIPPRMISPLA